MAYDIYAALAKAEGPGAAPEQKPVAPEGVYEFKILGANVQRSASTNLPMLKVQLHLRGGEYADVYTYISFPGFRPDKPKTESFLERNLACFLKNIGYDIRSPADGGPGIPDDDEKALALVGEKGKVFFKQETRTWEDQFGNEVTRIQNQPNWTQPDGPRQAAAAPAAAMDPAVASAAPLAQTPAEEPGW